MKIIAISDTHCYHRRIKAIPDGDILIHAGDITSCGEIGALDDFAHWMKELPHKHKVFIAGNHDMTLQRECVIRDELLKMFKDCGLIYLQDSTIVIDGISFYGSPWQPEYHSWSFNLPRKGKELTKKWDAIPDDTNVLITHGPPHMILDEAPRGVFDFENVGCEILANRIWELPKLKAHIFGHIHNSRGIRKELGVQFVNASICTEAYNPTNLPQEIEI